MNNGFLVFLGLLGSFAFSWAGLALSAHRQLGDVAPYFDKAEDKAFPEPPSGSAARGQLVYQDLGCVSCHTQQVRRQGYGNDIERKWGERQSWARDYIFQERVQLGSIRVGPDLANVGARLKSAAEIHQLLHDGAGGMPAYAFLYDEAPAGAAVAGRVVATVGDARFVPSARAMDLAAYLLSLNSPRAYAPEASHNAPKAPAAKEAAPKAGEAKQ
jgi:cytochrome c oxidase cbb3-type subunit 2